MASRRTLVEGLKAKPKADRRKEEAFVYGEADNATPEKPKSTRPISERKEKRGGEEASATPAPTVQPAFTGRVPLTTRIRPELANALKQASLKRQLAGEKPNTVQDILEEALEPWLKEKGYLTD